MSDWNETIQKMNKIERLNRHLDRAHAEFNGLVGRFLTPEEQLRVLSLGDEIDQIEAELRELCGDDY